MVKLLPIVNINTFLNNKNYIVEYFYIKLFSSWLFNSIIYKRLGIKGMPFPFCHNGVTETSSIFLHQATKEIMKNIKNNSFQEIDIRKRIINDK